MTFKEKYLAGEIEFEAIDDYVDEWNNSDDERTLAKFLGLNADEEDAWIDDGDEALKEIKYAFMTPPFLLCSCSFPIWD